LSAYPTLEKEMIRLKECGFIAGQGAVDISSAHDLWMGREELRRIAKLELLDEMEEWRLLASHYCLAWGWINATNAKDLPFESWRDVSKSDA